MTKTEIEELVRNTMASTQSPPGDKLKHPSQMELGKIYQDPNLQLNDQEWLQGFGTLERLNDMAGLSTIQTVIDTITKRVVNKFSSLLPKK
ncbi:26486_t:CDS:1, partial [Racocetra persica]